MWTSWLLLAPILLSGADDPIAALRKTPAKTTSAKRLTFEEDVFPILKVRCFKCHGEQARKAGLDLRRRFTIVKGGDN